MKNKTFTIRKTRSAGFHSEPIESIIADKTLDELHDYFGIQTGRYKSVKPLLKRINSDYDRRYECTYGYAMVELVEKS